MTYNAIAHRSNSPMGDLTTNPYRGRAMAAGKPNRKPLEKHGMSKTREYRAWADMLTRCMNPKFIKYEYYGGKGIKVCERWVMSFVAFYDDMGTCPPKHTLDRIESDKDYEPGNCRWVTQAKQMRNQGRNRMLTLNGKTQCLTDWAADAGMTAAQLNHRLERGWSVEKALAQNHIKGKAITFNGQTMNIAAWSKVTGIDAATLVNRLGKHGWSAEKALTTPVRRKRCSQSKTC